MQYRKEIPVKYSVDIFVAGGGPAGVAAAVMAARMGKSVYLAESFSAFGGAAVTMLVPAFMQFTNGVDFLAAGIGREVYDFIKNNCEDSFKPYCPTGIPVETIKLCYDEMITKAGVSFSFFTNVIDVQMNGNSVDSVICSAKSELFAVKASVYIDCTGDGELSYMAGADYKKGEEDTGEMMATTLCGLWTGMDWKKVQGVDSRELEKAFAQHIFSNEDRHLPGMWRIAENIGGSNAGHVYDIDGTNADSLTKAMLIGRKQLLEYRKYYREYLTGFEHLELVYSAACIGVRESRRIMGDYVMVLDDFVNRTRFPDEIGRYSYPVDIHAGKNTTDGYQKFAEEHRTLRYQTGESYGIPYRALTVKNRPNLLVAGRCISTDRYMQSSIRVMPGCYITGQAVGIAAAIAVDSSKAVQEIDVTSLQRELKKAGAFLPNFVE